MSETKEQIEQRTDAAFEQSPWRDPRADYRMLLRRLRERDTAAFESAVAEYDARVIGPLSDPTVDPVAAWLEYGRKLADIAGGGRLVRIDREGRSETGAESGAEPMLLLHLPADETAAAIVVAEPREPSPAQRAAKLLLAESRQSLPA